MTNLVAISISRIINSVLISTSEINIHYIELGFIFYEILFFLTPLSYFFFVQSFSIYENEKFKKSVIFPVVFYVAQIILLFTPHSKNFRWLFELAYNAEHFSAVTESKIFFILYILSFLILTQAFFTLITSKRQMPLFTKTTMGLFSVIAFATNTLTVFFCTAEIAYKPYSIFTFCFALSILLIYLNIQTPSIFTDSTTGFYNKTAFSEIERKFIFEKRTWSIGVIIDDINFLYSVYSIDIIKSLLKSIAEKIRKETGLTVYYFGHGQFCLTGHLKKYSKISPQALQDIFDKKCKIVQDILKEPQSLCGFSEIMVFSKIIIFKPSSFKTFEDVIVTLDTISTERSFEDNAIISAENFDTTKRKHEIEMSTVIKNSIRDRRIAVYYQPIYSCQKKRICGAEALFRLKNAQDVFLDPEKFIPIAEKTGSISRITEFVFEEVCKMIKTHSPQDFGVEKININLSVVQCMDKNFSNKIISIADSWKISHELINLEITETASSNYIKTLKQNMDDFVAQGIELSLDDYGSGLANLNYVLQLPFSKVKVDKEIIWQAFKEEKAKTALKATTNMIKELGMSILAEGIETEEQKSFLSSIGYDYLQGYYFAKPLPLENFIELLKTEMEKNPEFYEDVILKNKAAEESEILNLEEIDEI
ncbi:MAG: EAL domain-containing protein [Treponemataceae bacterium]